MAGNAWRPAPSNYAYKRAPLAKAPSKATLPAGYSIEDYFPPKDNYGRDQLFEALGLSLTKDGTVVVATRSAGLWRIVNGEWRLFAEGLFDSLGVVAEDAKGLVVVAGPEGRAHAHFRYERRWHRRQVRNAVRRALVSRELSQLHARSRAWQGWRLLLRAEPRARRRRHRLHGRRQRHGNLGRLQRLGRARRRSWQVPVVCERPAQSREPGREPRWPRLVCRQSG